MAKRVLDIPSRYSRLPGRKDGGIGFTEVLFDDYLQRKVILKRISDVSSTRRLLDEINALQQAKSDYVVQIYDILYKEQEGRESLPYGIIEEYLDGVDLTNFNTKDHTDREIVLTFYQIAQGLADLHDSGIIHRDIKPNNIKYDNEGILKIFDFNLAKSGQAPFSTKGLIGTPGFMAPELYDTEPNITFKTDTYAFGILTFCLLSGSLPPFSGKIDERPRQSLDNESISNLRALPKTIVEILDACVELDSEKRPDMADVVYILRKEISRDTHRGLMISGSYEHELSKDKRDVGVKRKNSNDGIGIEYKGTYFRVSSVSGDVFVNNSPANVGQELVGSYVIILGHKNIKWKRAFITFDVTNEDYVI